MLLKVGYPEHFSSNLAARDIALLRSVNTAVPFADIQFKVSKAVLTNRKTSGSNFYTRHVA
jgi:hypothetical protein